MTSATAYSAVRLVDAVYPVAIGAQALWAARHSTNPDDHVATGYTSRQARQPVALRCAHLLGLTSNLTNPMIAVSFLTFLPRFVIPGPDVAEQTALLGLLFNAMASSWWVVYVLALVRISAWLDRPTVRRAIERVTGTVLVALGVRLAVQR